MLADYCNAFIIHVSEATRIPYVFAEYTLHEAHYVILGITHYKMCHKFYGAEWSKTNFKTKISTEYTTWVVRFLNDPQKFTENCWFISRSIIIYRGKI